MDIAGENPAYSTPLLGYDCTGRWNQLFKLTENCTIMTQQPGVIGRVRGQGDKNIVSCLDNRHTSGVLMTAACEHLSGVANATVAVVDATGAVAASSTGDEVTSVAAQKNVSAFSAHQQYQFMPATGTVFKEFMK